MKILLRTVIIAALALCQAATADFITVERAYEIPLNLYRSPATSAGSVTFRECANCDLQTVRVTGQTRYVFNNESLDLSEFRRALAGLSDRANKYIIVLHHLESDTTTSVTLNL